jgi:hypothetical protein
VRVNRIDVPLYRLTVRMVGLDGCTDCYPWMADAAVLVCMCLCVCVCAVYRATRGDGGLSEVIASQGETVDASYNTLVIGFRSAFFVAAVLLLAWYAWAVRVAWVQRCCGDDRKPASVTATREQWWLLLLLATLVLYAGAHAHVHIHTHTYTHAYASKGEREREREERDPIRADAHAYVCVHRDVAEHARAPVCCVW